MSRRPELKVFYTCTKCKWTSQYSRILPRDDDTDLVSEPCGARSERLVDGVKVQGPPCGGRLYGGYVEAEVWVPEIERLRQLVRDAHPMDKAHSGYQLDLNWRGYDPDSIRWEGLDHAAHIEQLLNPTTTRENP